MSATVVVSVRLNFCINCASVSDWGDVKESDMVLSMLTVDDLSAAPWATAPCLGLLLVSGASECTGKYL